MKSWKNRLALFSGILFLVVVAIAILKLVFVDFVIDFWWFQSFNMTVYFLMRLFYKYFLLVFFTILFFAIFYANFRIAARFATHHQEHQKQNKIQYYLHHWMLRLYALLSLIMALPIAIPMYFNWEKALAFLFKAKSGVTDPIFNQDISFYFFELPIYMLVQKEVLFTFTILLFAVAFLYWNERRSLSKKGLSLAPGARVHICILFFIVVGILVWGILLERYHLVYTSTHAPVFHGPGFVEMRLVLPLIWLSAIFLAATGISLIIGIYKKIGWKLSMGFGVLFLLSILFRNNDFLIENFSKYLVAPNQLLRERPFINANIHSTLAAYGLDDIEIRDFNNSDKRPFDAGDPSLIRRLQNIPVWDQEMLSGVYEEIQGIRTYYSFPTIDVDRYVVEDSYRQVYLGAREIRFSKLPEFARNWVNMHLQYTHGEGVAMIPAAQTGDDFMTWFIKDIPPQSEFGLSSKETSIYYGLEDKPYVIVPNDAGEIGSPAGDGEVLVHYRGNGGVRVNSAWRKLLFSTYFKDPNIFFTTKTNERSRILFRRNIVDRIKHITPFLKLDQDPYIVVTPDGLFWIQDAYTTSGNYPLSPPMEEGMNYIRNSVKIIVDAYNGNVEYYISDPNDPVIKTYHRMYPGIFRPLEKMPRFLRNQIRYPRDIFLIQVAVYAKYNQTDPGRFFRQEDVWEFSKMPQGRKLVPAKPYYLTLDLIQPGKEEFLLFMPLSPFGRDNLRALMIAGNDGDNYGKLFIYHFPRNQHIYGPAQIHSLVNQDIVISEQFTLWNQEGSELILGKMLIEPTGGSLLYIQPVYLQEEGPLKIPQLKRLIMALDDAVVMAPSLEEAAEKLEAELNRKSKRGYRRQRPVDPPKKTTITDSPDQ